MILVEQLTEIRKRASKFHFSMLRDICTVADHASQSIDLNFSHCSSKAASPSSVEHSAYFPFSTHPSTFDLVCDAESSLHRFIDSPRIFACLQASNVKPRIVACVSEITGTFFSYSHIKSPVFLIVTGINIQPAVMPTASGNVARRNIPLFLATILPVMVATST